jgi:hypothetical protein
MAHATSRSRQHTALRPMMYYILSLFMQIIAYLAGLHYSGMWRPALVVAPATVLRQWMAELRSWYPPLRVILMHDSGRSPLGSSRPDRQGEREQRAALTEVLAPYLRGRGRALDCGAWVVQGEKTCCSVM